MKGPKAEQVALPQDRSAHLALRKTVDRYGDDVARALYYWFDALNVMFFDGALGAPMILVSPPNSRRAVGDYIPRDLHGLTSRIRIAPNVFELGMWEAVVTLLHEMVHAWATEIERDREAGYKGHGPKFTRKCNEIGAQLGYQTVYVKGRGGLDSSGWPHLLPKKIKAEKIEPEAIEPVELPPEPEGDDLADVIEAQEEARDWRRRYLEAEQELEELRAEAIELRTTRDELVQSLYIVRADLDTAKRVAAAAFEKEKAIALVRDKLQRENESLRGAFQSEQTQRIELSSEREEWREMAERWETRHKASQREAREARSSYMDLFGKIMDALHEKRGQLEALAINKKTSGGAPAQLRAIVKVLEGLGADPDASESAEA